jgi:hypothetical protein
MNIFIMKGAIMAKIQKLSQIKSTGAMMMLYGPTGVGKTTTIIQTSSQPILYVHVEERNVWPSIEASGIKNIDMDVLKYTDWFDTKNELACFEKIIRYRTVIIDGFTHLMGVALSAEIEDEAFEIKTEKEKKVKTIVNSAKMTVEGWGGLSSQMLRLCRLLGRLSNEYGKVIVCTALLDENNKYDRSLAAAPALKGKEFPLNMPGFFDFIGLVKTRIVDGKVVYPPNVFFESPNDNFMCKFTGAGTKRSGVLNVGKILGVK